MSDKSSEEIEYAAYRQRAAEADPYQKKLEIERDKVKAQQAYERHLAEASVTMKVPGGITGSINEAACRESSENYIKDRSQRLSQEAALWGWLLACIAEIPPSREAERELYIMVTGSYRSRPY